MAKAKASLPQSAAEYRQELQQRLSACRQELGDLAVRLDSEGDSPQLTEAIAAIRRAIAETEGNIELHDLAQFRAQQQSTQQDRSALIAECAAGRAEIADIGVQLAKVLRRLVEQIEDLGPVLAEMAALASRRRDLVLGTLNRARVDKRNPPLDHVMSSGDLQAMETAILGAIQRSGLGMVGPHLEPYVIARQIPSAKLFRNDMGTVTMQLAKVSDRYLEAVDKALAAIAPAPEA